MNLAADIARVAVQEQRLLLARFDLEMAWRLGQQLRELAQTRNLALAIEIRIARETVFFSAMKGVAPTNADWVRRKRNTVELLQRSSYGAGLELQQQGLNMQDTMGLPARDYAQHGGSFPLQLAGVGCIGAVTVSGAPQREDHAVVVQGLADLCGIPVDEVALD